GPSEEVDRGKQPIALKTELRAERMTGADPRRRNARYLACGHALCGALGPRGIACDVAPSHRWSAATASALPCCSAFIPVDERENLHGAPDSRGRRCCVASMQRPCHSRERKRKWVRASNQDDRLNRQDKSTGAEVRLSGCLHI